MERRERVLLIQPPFAPLQQPSCALGCLKASLVAHRIPCRCEYVNLDLIASLDTEVRRWISREAPGPRYEEWIYSSVLFPEYVSKRRYLQAMRSGYDAGFRDYRHLFMKLFRATHRFNRDLIGRWRRRFPYTVVGISANYSLMPALFCCSILKKLHPDIQTVLGGSECISEVGHALARTFPFIDWVVDGEGEEVLPEIVRIIEQGSDEVPAGTSRRLGGRVIVNATPRRPIDITNLPLPDYDDYFCSPALRKIDVPIALPIEAGRGCWWGRCSFCNAPCRGSRFYRRVSDSCVLMTMEYLADRHRNLDFLFVDSVQPARVESLAKVLIGSSHDFHFTMWLRSEITAYHLSLLKKAGLRYCFFGIESFSDRVLEMMNKGTTVIDNIVALRAVKQLGMRAFFHMIHGHPGERAEDRRAISRTMRHISHLIRGPVSEGPFALLYGSNVYHHPKEYHIKAMTTDAPFLPPALRFTPTFCWNFSPTAHREKMVPAPMLKGGDGGSLELHAGGKAFCIVEDRRTTMKRWRDYVLTPPHSDVLIACMAPKKRSELKCRARVLRELIAKGLVIESKGRYLTLATRDRTEADGSFAFHGLCHRQGASR